MKKRVWKGKRLFSLLLAFVMLASIMPLELLVGAIGTPVDSAEDADVSVVMTADQEKCAIGGTANVTLTVTLNNDIDKPRLKLMIMMIKSCLIWDGMRPYVNSSRQNVIVSTGLWSFSPKILYQLYMLSLRSMCADGGFKEGTARQE